MATTHQGQMELQSLPAHSELRQNSPDPALRQPPSMTPSAPLGQLSGNEANPSSLLEEGASTHSRLLGVHLEVLMKAYFLNSSS